jgi:hypothetical protein
MATGKHVIFLGAGASKNSGYPLANDLRLLISSRNKRENAFRKYVYRNPMRKSLIFCIVLTVLLFAIHLIGQSTTGVGKSTAQSITTTGTISLPQNSIAVSSLAGATAGLVLTANEANSAPTSHGVKSGSGSGTNIHINANGSINAFNILVVFNILEYGADPTGSADSGLAVSNAFIACSNNGGGIVYAPAGTYKMLECVHIPYITNTQIGYRLTGDGEGSTSFAFATTPKANDVADIEARGYGNVILDNFSIGNNLSSGAGASLPHVRIGSAQHHIHDVYFGCGASPSTLQTNIVLGGTNVNSTGPSSNSYFGGYVGVIDHCTFSCPACAVLGLAAVNGEVIENNYFNGGPYQTVCTAYIMFTIGAWYCSICNNTFEMGNFRYGIWINAINSYTSQYNHIYANGMDDTSTNTLAGLYLGSQTRFNTSALNFGGLGTTSPFVVDSGMGNICLDAQGLTNLNNKLYYTAAFGQNSIVGVSNLLATNIASSGTYRLAPFTATGWTNTNTFNCIVDFTNGVTNLCMCNSVALIFRNGTNARWVSRVFPVGANCTNASTSFTVSQF